MSGILTVSAITENIVEALGRQGLSFRKSSHADCSDMPASQLPAGLVEYKGEEFDASYGQRPSYVEATYLLRVIMAEEFPDSLIREQQKWCHRIRDAVTVEALNSNSLASSKLVSRVAIGSFDAQSRGGLSYLTCNVAVRYREA